jgi:hypothetical protein
MHTNLHENASQIKKEFKEYCEKFDMEASFKSIVHMLCRPGIKDFVKAHPHVSMYTYTCMYIHMRAIPGVD